MTHKINISTVLRAIAVAGVSRHRLAEGSSRSKQG
jgi:hypothetical protein